MINAATYYIAADGDDDENVELSAGAPWQSILQVLLNEESTASITLDINRDNQVVW